MKFWVCFTCLRVKDADEFEMIPSEGWKYALTNPGENEHLIAICPVCAVKRNIGSKIKDITKHVVGNFSRVNLRGE